MRTTTQPSGGEATWRRLRAVPPDDEKEDDVVIPNNQDSPEEIPTFGPPLPRPALVALAYVSFISFWPLLAYIERNFQWDVNTFMTLNDLMDTANPERVDTILELPKLSPAEQLVDALFGPPGVDRRGY